MISNGINDTPKATHNQPDKLWYWQRTLDAQSDQPKDEYEGFRATEDEVQDGLDKTIVHV